MSADFDRPKWDVALEALLNEEYGKQQVALEIEDLQRLAVLHSIRFDDILDTLMIMCVNNAWQYKTAQGEVQAVTQDDYDTLFENGRTTDEGVAHYDGSWHK